MHRRAFLSSGLSSAIAAGLAFAAAPFAASAAMDKALTEEAKALVAKATAYIQGLKTVSGKFTQTAPNGSMSTGVFSMKRPGKARFQYDAPAEMVIVSDGSNVSVYDARLKTFDRFPLSRTPLNLLLAREVRLDRGVVISAVDPTPTGFTISARDGRKEAEGRIVLVFSDEPIALRGWTVVDSQGAQTRVQLGDLTPSDGLDASLFVLQDPRPRSNRP